MAIDADLLRIRASSTMLRMRGADDINRRLRFFNTGSHQEPTVTGTFSIPPRTAVVFVEGGCERGSSASKSTATPLTASPRP
jgi:hypothetical protein